MFLNASRFNHSCFPNADGFYDSKSDHLKITALADIRANEEITISYIPHLIPRAQRQELLSTWRFVCHCQACDVHNPSSIAYEARRRSISRLQADLLKYVDGTVNLPPTTTQSRPTLDLAAEKVQKVIDLLAEDASLRRYSFQMCVNGVKFSEPLQAALLTVHEGTCSPSTSQPRITNLPSCQRSLSTASSSWNWPVSLNCYFAV